MSASAILRRPALALWVLACTACLACGAAPREDGASRRGQVQSVANPARGTPPAAESARAGLRRLHFDLAASQVWVASADSFTQAVLGSAELAGRWGAFRELLAREATAPWSPATREMARALGRELLQPVAPQLQGSTAWEVSPLELAPLGAVIPPWSSSDEPVQAEVVVWYSAATTPPTGAISMPELADCIPSPTQQAAMPRPSGILAVAPFRTGVPAALDDPDTMLWAMRRAVRDVQLIPRNDTGAAAIEGALREHRFAMSWLRAAPEQAATLLAPLDRGPLLLWWTLAGPPAQRIEPILVVARSWLAAPRGLALDLWPRDPQGTEAGIREFLAALRDGSGAAPALQAGAEALRTQGAAPAQWAGWIYVGIPSLTATLQAPGWLQRAP